VRFYCLKKLINQTQKMDITLEQAEKVVAAAKAKAKALGF
jgi:hypothetical protein